MSTAAIAVVEPQMQSMAHAPFNAALLHTVALAYPSIELSFHAEPDHAVAVRELLHLHAPEAAERVSWQPLASAASGSLAARWRHSRRTLRGVLRLKRRTLFASISRMQLLHLQQMMREGHTVRAVFHGELEQIGRERDSGLIDRFFSLHRLLLKPRPPGLRYLLLGRSIFEAIPDRYRSSFEQSAVFDHPYHLADDAPGPSYPAGLFGIFGNSGNGRMIEAVAREVKRRNAQIRFRLLGFVENRAAAERLRGLVEDVNDHPISRESFVNAAKDLGYGLWLAPPGAFRLRASGTFLDALAFTKPVVYTANPFIDAYATTEPSIGWRADSLEQVAQTILDAVSSDETNYREAQAAVRRLRERFTPQVQAPILRGALDWD